MCLGHWRLRQKLFHPALPGQQAVFAPRRTDNIERDNVARALPDAAQVRIPEQSRPRPLFDITATAAHFHRITDDLARITTGAVFEQRRQDSQPLGGLLVAGVRVLHCQRRLQKHRARLFGCHDHLRQLTPHQWHLDQWFAEGRAVIRNMQRLECCPAHHPGGPYPVGKPRRVDHVGHLFEARLWITDQPGGGALQAYLAAGHRTCAQFVLEAHNPVVVRLPIG